jgi:putative glutamine transport system substrate-binding protein
MLLLSLVLAFGAMGLIGCGSDEPAPSDEPTEEPAADALPAGVQEIADRGTLRVGVKADVPNFGLQDAATGEYSGMEIDLAYALAERIGLTADDVEFEAVTAKTRGPLLDNGQLDVVIATFTIKPERLEQWNFTDAYYQDEVGLLVKKDSGIEALADLDGKRIGVAQGATTRDAVQVEADAAGIKVEFLEFATYPEINAALESGRVDAFSVDKSILSGYVTDDSVILPDVGFSPQDYGVASKLGTDDLRDFMNDMFAEMAMNGEMDALLEKWGLN